MNAQALIEFSLVLPLLVLLLFALVDGSTVLRTSMTCKAAAEEAARIVAQDPDAALGDKTGTIAKALASVEGARGVRYAMEITESPDSTVSYKKEVPDSGKPGLDVTKTQTYVTVTCTAKMPTRMGQFIGSPEVTITERAGTVRVR